MMKRNAMIVYDIQNINLQSINTILQEINTNLQQNEYKLLIYLQRRIKTEF